MASAPGLVANLGPAACYQAVLFSGAHLLKVSGKSCFCAASGGGNRGKALWFLNDEKGETCIKNGRGFLPHPTTAMVGAATDCFEVLSFSPFAIICAQPFQQKHSLLVARGLAEEQKAGFLH